MCYVQSYPAVQENVEELLRANATLGLDVKEYRRTTSKMVLDLELEKINHESNRQSLESRAISTSSGNPGIGDPQNIFAAMGLDKAARLEVIMSLASTT